MTRNTDADSASRTPPAPVPRDGSGEMFDAIARRYDLLNRLMSFGVDQRWRCKTVDTLRLGPETRVLDVATGTGDLAVHICKRVAGASVVGIDPSPGMLALAARKVARHHLGNRVVLQMGDGEQLPYRDESFDGATIAFGIRNVPDRARVLLECARVLRPGARLAVLELSEPRRGVMGHLARFHIRRLVPWLGGLLSGSREYRYLQRSIAAFPPPAQFGDLMGRCGFDVERVAPLTFGVCVLYVGLRPA